MALLSAEVKSPEERLKILRAQLKEQKEKIAELKFEKTDILKNIQELDKEISLNTELINVLKRKKEITNEEKKNIELLMNEIHYRLQEKREILGNRIKEIYIHGPLHPIEVILLSYSFSDALKRIKFLTIIADQDKRVLDEIERLEDRLTLQKERIDQKAEILDEILYEVKDQEIALAQTKKEKNKYLNEIEGESKKAVAMSKEMEKAMEDLEKLIRSLSRQESAPGSKYFSEKIIKLPVNGMVTGYFGRKVEERYGTVTMNRGLDIEAPWGTNVEAVAPGKVVYNDNFLGYGKLILIQHGEGLVTLYSHLASATVENGIEVQAGDIIGKVGQTGSVKKPTLHFEIRKNGIAVNPFNYINL
ncbi:MAG: peptidoglycan DD-metalloendopeptidase family protein [candidate division WOR-3 bacterium]